MKKLIFLILGLIVIGLVATWTVPYWTHGSTVVTVTDVDHKLMKDHGKTKDIYLIFTTDGTYKNVDSPAYFKFNSSDIQGKLAAKGKFKIDYYGFRVPILSMYKNITKAEKVPE